MSARTARIPSAPSRWFTGAQRRAHQPRGEQRLQERRMVGSQPRHPVAAPDAKPLQAIGQAPNPPGYLPIGERAIFTHQRHLIRGDPGATLNPGADPEVGPSGRQHSHGQWLPATRIPQARGHPRHADPKCGCAFTSPRHTPKRTGTVMQVSVLIPTYGRSPRSGHKRDQLTAARTGLEREAGQRFGWSTYVWSPPLCMEPPPESNRRPHPYHGTTRNRCADDRFPR
jgi:hypothetical protein